MSEGNHSPFYTKEAFWLNELSITQGIIKSINTVGLSHYVTA